MKKINISVITDSLFAFAVSAILALCVFRYFRLPYAPTIIAAVLIGIAFAAPTFFILSSIRGKSSLARSEEKEKNKLMLHLALLKQEEILYILCSMRGITHNIGYFYAVDKSEVLYPIFTVEQLSAEKIAEVVKEFPPEKLTIFCNALTPAASKLCRDLKIKIVSGEDVYSEMKKKNLLPEKYIGDLGKRSFREKFSQATAKTNSRPFILGGLGLMIFSMFTLFPTYYLISGIILLAFGVIIRFIPKHNS